MISGYSSKTRLVRGTAFLGSNYNATRFTVFTHPLRCSTVRYLCSETSDNTVLQEWSREVQTFGSVTIRLAIPTRVVPISLTYAPNMDKARVRILGPAGCETGPKVEVDVGGEGIMVSSATTGQPERPTPVVCVIEVPVKYGVVAALRGPADVSVEGLEGEHISLQTDEGRVYTKDIKCGSIKLVTRAGDIICEGAALGNVDIRAGGSGRVSCDRMQGQEVVLANETGPISIKALYADRSSFSSLGGPVSVGSIHGNSTITIKEGQLDIGALDGSLKAMLGKGDINVQVSRHEAFQIKTESGDINLKLPSEITASLRLKGRFIQFDEKVGAVGMEQRQGEWKVFQGALGEGKDSNLLEATARGGRIRVVIQDWGDSVQATRA